MATATRTQADRDARKKVRRIHVYRRGPCRFCGQLIEPGTSGHTTLDRLAAGRPFCHGKPRGPYRYGVSITKNGLRSDTYPLTAEERERYHETIEALKAEVKERRVGRLRREVPA